VSAIRLISAQRKLSWASLVVLAAVLSLPFIGHAQPNSTAGAKKSAVPVSEGTPWASLSSSQKSALKPLEREWGSIDAPRKVKWLEIANKFSTMPPAEQARVQNRMEDWAKMSPKERGQVRLNYKEAQQVPAQERKARWEAYQALPPDQQKQLAARAVPPARKAGTDASPESTGAKSNVVPNSSYAPRPKAVAPTVAQAQPGATTNLITKRPSPPAHQQAGLPKIASTSGFVDQSTLLPKRGPQGAATRSAAASSPAVRRP
jgi:hypothetical protein